jgi:hypothetical protein
MKFPAIRHVSHAPGGRFVIAIISVAALFLGLQTRASAQFSEYEVKAAFISNFAQFVKWPEKAFPNAGAPLVIGVLGDDPFGSTLEKIIQSKSVEGRKLSIRRSHRIEDLKNCQLIFVSRSEQARVSEIVGSLRGTSALTVGDMEGFARMGGVIGFKMEGNNVRFEINLAAARSAELKISSKLLALSKIVG